MMEKEISIEELNGQIEEQEAKLDRARKMVGACDRKANEYEQKLKDVKIESQINDDDKMLDYVVMTEAISTVLRYKNIILEQAEEEIDKLNGLYDQLWMICEALEVEI